MRWSGWVLLLCTASPCFAGWKMLPPHDNREALPKHFSDEGKPIRTGDKLPDDSKYRWLLGDLEVPESIHGHATAGQPVGLQFNCGDGGEIYVDGLLQCRYDNDHPGLAFVAERARPGQAVHLAVQVYAKVQGAGDFSQADWVILDPKRALQPLSLTVRADQTGDAVPDGIIGLSQGGGMSDYEPDTARKLKEAGFKWFRMDNVLTNAIKRDPAGKLAYDWTDLDKRVDFIYEIGAKPIFSASYMPQVFDAIPDPERHSAPRDYGQWQELCRQAAAHCLARAKPVGHWEVWNETNAGWLKPGPQDTGTAQFTSLYSQATGNPKPEHETVRRFEAYCKLYRATALGVREGDPNVKVGGPVLASGPYDSGKDGGPGVNGKGFARGLMLWCAQEKLPLDFLSWHEYFQSADTIAKEADTFRSDAAGIPGLPKIDRPLMITEWNEAWWPDRPQDHELGAAWCADCVTRAFIPDHIQYPCFFYVKQGDRGFRGDWSLLMGGNLPKASYNMARIFNGLSGRWVKVSGGDADVSAVAALGAGGKSLKVVLVDFRDRYALARHVHLDIHDLPSDLRNGQWRQWTVDATHSNAWNDMAHAELQQTGAGSIAGPSLTLDRTLGANSVTLIELSAQPNP